MKKAAILLTVSLSMISFVGCQKDTVPQTPAPKAEQKPIQISPAVANSTTNFAFDFFKKLQEDPSVSGDIFVSPLSLHMALGMLVNGATAETKAEIMKTLKAENLSQDELNESYKKLMAELPKADSKVKMALANSIWYRNGFTLEAPFLTAMKDYFDAKIQGINFAPSDTSYINGWARDNTNGKIKKVLDEFSGDLFMLLMNALYFKGDWTVQFDPKNTKDQNFTLESGSVKSVKMMNLQDSLEYVSMSDYDVLRMPYGSGQFVATLILPKSGKTIGSVFNGLDANKWGQIETGLRSQTVVVGVPKFKLEKDYILNRTLQSLGMLRAFTPAAQLDGLLKNAPLEVSFVKQNTYVGVDEVGTEAAAVTTIGVIITSVPSYPTFICNRPFGFIISEKTSNTILFMGRIMDPKAG